MDKMKQGLTDVGLLWLRVLAGTGIAWHGYQKIFGGYLPRLAEGLTSMGFPIPEVFAWAAALAEFGGGICLALGLFIRPAALFIFITMSVAVFIAHQADPLEKKELALAYWTVAGALMMTGAGRLSLDALLGKKRGKK